MKKILILLVLGAMGHGAVAQNATSEITIHTSAVCGTCKKTIEEGLSFEKGVKSVHLDLDSNTVRVTYNPQKTDAAKIGTALTKLGYDADSLKADPKAVGRLPECCQHPHPH